MKNEPRQSARKASLVRYIFVIAVLSATWWHGRTRSGPELTPHFQSIFPQATTFKSSNAVSTALDAEGKPLGWLTVGSAPGFGGPMLVAVGIQPNGEITGASVVEHKETPMFFQMVKAPDYFASLSGRGFDSIHFEEDIDAVTGATLSTEALAASVKDGVTRIAAEQFDVHIPVPARPFEFGLLELAVILLFAMGFGAQYLSKPLREVLRWATQVAALLIIGFSENSPITLAKITALLSGYLPDARSNLALYLLIGGFALSVLFLGKDLYCLHVCPFGAAQRFINAIGGKRLSLPLWSVRLMNNTRNRVVLVAIAAALATAQPARASYEPFAALFALTGTTLQWFLLLIILVVSFFIRRPWCHFFCPMRSCERALLDIRTNLLRSKT